MKPTESGPRLEGQRVSQYSGVAILNQSDGVSDMGVRESERM